MNSSNQQGSSLQGTQQTVSKKTYLITLLIAFVLLVGIWIWKEVQISNVKEKSDKDRQALQEQAEKMIVSSHKEHLKLLAKPFVWAVRSEMMRGNINQVNLYANEMVKEKNFQSIVVANDKGIIVSSTNKKDEGEVFATVGKADYLTNNNTIVDNVNDSLLITSSPVMGFNNRLGTLMITYTIEKPKF